MHAHSDLLLATVSPHFPAIGQVSPELAIVTVQLPPVSIQLYGFVRRWLFVYIAQMHPLVHPVLQNV